MSSRDRDVDADDVPREKRSSRTKGDRDRTRDKDRDRESRRHHKSHRSSNPVIATGSYVSQSGSARRHKLRDASSSKSRLEEPLDENSSMTDLVPELNRSRDRVHIPYPTFSKAHSKESVASKDDLTTSSAAGRGTGTGTGTDPLTPETTDLGTAEDIKRSKSADFGSKRKLSRKADRPPSPPDTNLSEEKKGSTPSVRLKEAEDRPRSRTSHASRSTFKTDETSKLSRKSKSSSQATFVRPSASKAAYADTDNAADSERDPRSAATSVTTKRSVSGNTLRPPGPDPIDVIDDSPESAQESSSPKTPTNTTPQFPPPPMFHDDKHGIPYHMRFERPQQVPTPATDFTDLSNAQDAPPPPPPPPPPLNIQEAPKVDYLMQNGGLTNVVPKNFLAVLPRQNGTRPSNPPLRGAETLFAPFFNLLDQYQEVLTNRGSIAVATGHRTVARRLLDRLEDVFNRDLPEEGCSCIMCEKDGEKHRGLGWGEVLERVSGRVEIPSWPPFDIGTLGVKAPEAAPSEPPRPSSPVKIDPDIAEEFREHYLRQSKKVKAAVDRWLTNCAEAPAPPPQDVDDETLTFAILTALDQEDRPYFNALLTGARELQPALRAPTPMRKPRADLVIKSGLALQRLYRLPQAPRDAETVCYLVKHPQMHDLLSTICDINPPEWEILISGRFDGFLWSGADADDDDAATPTAGPSRGATPNFFPQRGPPSRGATMSPNNIARFTPALGIGTRNTTPFSRGTTPASFVSGASSAYPNRQAVSNDEESEIAVLAELEREIYVGMEALEDAFETLHQRAELVRTALRQRGAGLSMSLQQRRGYGLASDVNGGIQVLPQSGGSVPGMDRPQWADEESLASESTDDWGIDADWELRPDDSASNISSSRQRRPKRRDERRSTPAPIREEDET
ncbi:hypothetical protein KVR01_002630 [Diaporthe batatas]|uniref:uncharacterized protein n=1 Tax=Diaporthe batatas TaxID=748121 RepID=UPI001D05884D|nr:uncharacterized protein KVR01_002630 [Diaporthe batatas]KAG8166941.1 hypothetical protein KVR01_002630 [Diaporthe batatas]